jgi:hypothetical protein
MVIGCAGGGQRDDLSPEILCKKFDGQQSE